MKRSFSGYTLRSCLNYDLTTSDFRSVKSWPKLCLFGYAKHYYFQLILQICFCALSLFAGTQATFAVNSDCLVIGTSYPLVDGDVTRDLGQEFVKHGHCLRFVSVPPRRSAVMLRDGHIDGEILRTRAYAKAAGAHSVVLEQPILYGQALLVSRYAKYVCSGCEPNISAIGVREGLLWPLNHIPAQRKVEEFPTYLAGLEMLNRGRITSMIIDSITFDVLITKDDYIVEPLTDAKPVFFVLSKSHLGKKRIFEDILSDYYSGKAQ